MRKIKNNNQVIKKYVQDNIKEIALSGIIFLIGTMIGVILINNITKDRKE